MAVALVSRWARRYVALAVAALVATHAAVLAGASTRSVVTLALYGFVLHVVFGKAYSLVPTYFDRDLAAPRAMVVQLPLTGLGVAGMAAAASLESVPGVVGTAGALAWTAGVVVFVAALAWTIRSNPTGAETATGEGKAHLAGLDRAANAFVPFAVLYLLAGSYATLVAWNGAPAVDVLAGAVPVFDGYPPRATHLLGAGTATLLVVALGARLWPRFLVVDPPRGAFVLALATGAVGPVVLAASVPVGDALAAGALLEATAVTAYAVAYVDLFRRSDRRRVAFRSVLVGALAGVAAVGLGAWFAVVGLDGGLVAAHRRLTLLGFLGLTVVGATFQFYPPTVGRWRYCTDRTASVVVGALAAGVALQAIGAGGGLDGIETLGALVGLAGALGYGYLLAGAFATR
ncbi:hypothetical protein [Halorubellus sp. PRR65]|uniref:hypothetical protein n=1 Tax=Halorubellus sp. PRR65 TaxID=3098148 RepID=UPI002B260D31|nr:hypothetical protein [Halorubellus sp. PRR65]